jgi:hypothetical protein
MIKGEKDFIQAIKSVRAKGAIKAELLCILEIEYKRNPDPILPLEDISGSESLEDLPMDAEAESRNKGHVWDIGWMDTENQHPGFGGSTGMTGAYVDQCAKCGMYGYEFQSLTETPGKYEGQICDKRIR